MSYAPRPGSLPARAIALLEEGPLALAVLADRIGQDINTVRSSLGVALERGTVRRERDPRSGCWIYSIGDGIPLYRAEPGETSGPSQRTVPAADVSPGVDIDRVHRNTPWRQPLTGPVEAFALVNGRLRITREGESEVTLDAEHTRALRRFFAETAW